jgi:hypothetical protein
MIAARDAALLFEQLLELGCFGQSVDDETSCFGFEPECEGANCRSICERIAGWEACWDTRAECDKAYCGEAFCARRDEMTKPQVQEALVRDSAPLFAELRTLAASLPDAPDARRLREQLRAWEGLLATGDVAQLPSGEWQRQGLTLFADDDVVGEIDSGQVLAGACDAESTACRATFERLGSVWTLALSQQTLLRALQRDHRDATVRYLRGLDQRWRSYLLGGRSLFPWERWVNGEIHRRLLVDERGFVEPPARQLLFLHPEAAYEYRDFSEDGLEEVLTLEVVGFYRWRWSEDAELVRPWGGSLLVSWDGSEQDSIGYGVMAHLPRNWSLGIVVRQDAAADDEIAVLLAADLPKLFVKTTKLRDRLKELRFATE